MANTAHPHTHFERLWLAESLRLLEEQQGPLDDQSVRRQLLTGSFAERILARAAVHGSRLGFSAALQRWQSVQRLSLPLLALFAVLSGASLASALLGSGSAPVNVFVLLLGLGGLSSLTLLLWLLGVCLGKPGSVIGQLWLNLQQALNHDGNAAWLMRGYVSLLLRGKVLSWQLAAFSHIAWLLHLLGALGAVLVLLSLRRYGFVWESTLFSADGFVALAQGLGHAADWLGLSQPTLEQISRSDQWQRHDAALQQAWSGWLLGILLLGVLLPRLLAALVCAVLVVRRRSALTLDLSQPGFIRLQHSLQQQHLGVLDAETPAPDGAPTHSARPTQTAGHWLVGLELVDDEPWPTLSHAELHDGGVLRQRQQSHALLDSWQHGAPAKLLLLCDARQTPDRGLSRWLHELADSSGQAALYLLHAEHSPRLALWQQLDWPHPLLTDSAQAHAWLENP